MSKKFLDFSDKFWRGCRNFILHVHRNSLRKNTFLKSVFIVYHFGTLSRNLFAIFRKFFRRVVKTVFYLPIGSFRKNNSFTNLCFPNFFGPWTKTFQPLFRKLFGGVVKTAFYVSRGTVGGKLYFLKKVYFLFIFAHWDEDFSPFLRKISVVPSNFHSTSP